MKARVNMLVLLILILNIFCFNVQAAPMYGDLNNDGGINSIDFALMRMHLLGISTISNSSAADLDGSGSVNSIDFALLRSYLLGIIEEFPVQRMNTPTPIVTVTPVPTTSGNSGDWDWAGIIGTGQSLAVGAQAYPGLTVTQPYNNIKLSLGSLKVPPFDYNSNSLSVVPLVEPIRNYATGYPGPYPGNIYGETPHSAMGNQITYLSRTNLGKDYITAHSVVGESGQGMSAICKGATDNGSTGRAYAASMFEVSAFNRLAKSSGKTYGVGGIFLTHGESDCGSNTYKGELYKMWSDYNTDIKAITGQTKNIPLFISQQHSVPSENWSSTSMLAAWQLGVEYPGDIICTGPKYQYPYDPDHVHLNALGYQMLGEKYGEVYYETVVLGKKWQPLQPVSAAKSGKVITVNFNVPNPPLAWDANMGAPNQTKLTEWKNGKGFEVSTYTGRVTISSVEISGNSVIITCATELPASGVRVGYANTASGSFRNGGTARWGLLKDSDPFVGSTTGKAQPNYCVSFELDVK